MIAALQGDGRPGRRRRRVRRGRRGRRAGRRHRQGRVGDHHSRRRPGRRRSGRRGRARQGPEGDSTQASDAALHERVRKAAGAASRAVAGHDKVVSTLAAIDLTAAAEGHLLGAYVFDTYKKPSKAPVESDRADRRSRRRRRPRTPWRRAVVTAEAVAFARDLINTAPNDLYPAEFAARASAAAGDGRADGRGARREGAGQGRLRRDPRGRRRLDPAAAAGPDQLLAGQADGPRSPWSARASPSTPAASRSSRPRRWTR